MIVLKKTLTILILCLITVIGRAATVDTALTQSAAMHKSIKAVVVKPEGYNNSKRYPVLYLLHGFSGNYSDWIKKVPAIAGLADQYQVIIVCPDGNFGSWYFDSPENKDFRYETYVGTELVNWIDKHYQTIANRSGRAITGLSMGGHGALYLAFKHLNTFGAAGSMSGAMDIRPFSDSFGIEQLLGKYSEKPEQWDKNSVIDLIYLLKPNSLAITFDCGNDDFFAQVNREFHEKLMERRIPHDYAVRPGAHTWEYWGNSIKYQMLFFSDFFKNKKQG